MNLERNKYPYKKIDLTTVEIINFISHSNYNVTILIKEGTINYMTKLRNYFLDFPNLLFATYSETGLAPARAQINIINDQTDYFSESTQFNILSSIDVRLAQALNYSKYSAVEMNISAYSFAIIIINRWNFNITNINVYRNVTLDRNLDVPFIIAIYEQINIVTIANMDFHISGRILTSNQPINLHVENVYMDFYGMMGGIYINADWNYPEASIIGNILITNVTAENTQTRITPFLSGILYYAGPANVTVQNTNVLIYGSLLDSKSSIEIHSNKNWIPIDDEVQIITIQYNLFRLSLNPVNERFVETFIEITENYPRKIQTNIFNNVINNVVYNVFPVFYWFFTSNSDIYITNNTITHVSSRQGIMVIDSMNSVTLRDTNVYNSTDFGHYLYYLSNVQNITLQNIKLENVTATGTTTDRMFLFDVINNGTIWIDLVYMKNVDIGLQPGFYFNGLLSKVSYTNMYFENISVGDNNRMITTGEFKTLEINNITFINTNGQYVSDTTNYMIYIDIINLNSATNSTISNIYVQSSTVNILKMQNVVGSALTPVCMNFRNITYRDSYVKLKQSFILYSNVESQEQFYTVFDQVTFSNVTLRSGGYLMDFGQQTLTQVVVRNLVFSNIYAGTIHLESSYKVLPYKTKVLIQNGKFENVNSNTESIFLLNEGAELEIRNSSFNQISCTESGGVIYSSYQFTVTSIYDSSFTNSSSVKAALFLIEDGGVIRLYRWSMVQNFAVSSTLMHASNNGYFEIYDSKITQNYGIINIVSEVINSINLWIIDNTKIYNNQFMTISDIFLEFTETWKLLWFVPSNLSSYIISNPSLYNFLIESKMFELISARLIIQNKSVIYNQLSIAKSFMSSLTFLDSTFYNLMIREKGIRIAESTINITDWTFYNISASDTTSFVDAGINTIVYLTNTTYSNWTWPFMVTSVATVTLDRITISNCYPHLEWISILRAPFVSITNSSMNMAYSDNSTSPFRILDSKVDLIANTSINNLNQYAIYFSLWNVTMIDGLHVSNTFGIYLRNVNIDRITNSMFENNGKGYNSQDQLSTRGGAILSLSSNFTIDSLSIFPIKYYIMVFL